MTTDRQESERAKITVIGAGCVGASIGLALRASADGEHLQIVGHDRDHAQARRAQRLGAFDKVSRGLHGAIRDARLIIIAVPLAALQEVFQDLGRLVDPGSGTVVTDTGPLKVPAITWAEAALPAGVHYVGGDPFLAPDTQGWEPLIGLTNAGEDLFKDAVYAITARAEDPPSAVRMLTHLALVLGATPLFMDPVEHDAVRHMTDTVPSLLATAQLNAATKTPGWLEIRRAAGRAFATATAAASGDAASRSLSALQGRDAVLRGLDAVIAELQALRGQVAADDGTALASAMGAAMDSRARWIAESKARSWTMGESAVDREDLFRRTLTVLRDGPPGGRRVR
jgi:prephenate dehydrogenase